MAGLLVELALSWALLWWLQKENLGVLGFYPQWERLQGFFLLLLVAVAGSVFAIGLRVLFFKEVYGLNPLFNGKLMWEGFRWNAISVLYEEFIFRGALLYILIRRLGATKAIAISAIAFGIYHWFSYNILGNAAAMVQVFLITGILGWILAFSYARTGSLYMATGFHLGWNFTYGFLFSKGSIGKGLFILTAEQPAVTVSYFTYYTVTLLPFVLVYVVSYIAIRKHTSRAAGFLSPD